VLEITLVKTSLNIGVLVFCSTKVTDKDLISLKDAVLYSNPGKDSLYSYIVGSGYDIKGAIVSFCLLPII